MEDGALIENQELERQRVLRSTQRKDATAKSEQVSTDDPSEEEREKEAAALNVMTLFDVAGDLFGWVPFIGAPIAFIAGVLAVIQSFKLNPTIRVKAWIINGVMALIKTGLNFIFLGFIPTETIGAILIRIMASNTAQEKTKQPK